METPYRTILVPLDGSRFAEAALPLALSVSRRSEAAVHLVTVLETAPSFVSSGWEAAAGEWAGKYLGEVVERIGARAGGDVTTAILQGSVVATLRDEADEVGADLVVMATHGRGALSRAWLGSVADGFIRRARRPILLVRPREDDETPITEEVAPGRILVPLDGSDAAEEALERATGLGTLFGGAYHLLRVVASPLAETRPYLPHTRPPERNPTDEAVAEAQAYLDGLAGELRGRGLEVETEVATAAQPAHAILEAVEEQGCDLVVMGTRARKGLTRALLGSTADKVLRGTDVPVFLHRRGE